MDWSINYRVPREDCVVSLPPSKSVAARAMMLGASAPTAILCDDLAVLRDALLYQRRRVYVGSSGTALRFLTARFACMTGVDVIVDGTEQLRSRPVGALVDALRSLGADIVYLNKEGFAPLRIKGKKLCGGRIVVDASMSSQYVSALLLSAPFMNEGVELETKVISSLPYIEMTCDVCREFGIKAGRNGNVFYAHSRQRDFSNYSSFRIEADWSAASYFMEIAALTDSKIVLKGLDCPQKSIQGDARSVDLFALLGVGVKCNGDVIVKKSCSGVSSIDADMRNMPDVVPALAVSSALSGIPFRLRGLETLRIKESDRIDGLQHGLRHLGFAVESGCDCLEWNGNYCPNERTMVIDACDDHRMAMAFAPAAIMSKITILGADCVSKSFPDFEVQIAKCGFKIEKD